MNATPAHAAPPASQTASATFRGPFAVMTVLFFMWGFMTVWNDILIPHFKEAFTLTYFQAMLVQFAFFGAYAFGSSLYIMATLLWGDPINRIGYKNAVIIGLLTAALGSALFYPASAAVSYPLFLGALFVVGIGFAMLQIAANPYVTILGPERTASSRLNLSQAFNSFGTTIGPLVAGWLVFKVFASPGAHGAGAVKIPYLCCAAIFVIIAMLFKCARLPAFTNHDKIERGLGVLRRPHVTLGILAIFMYVGAEVAVGSAIVSFLGSPALGALPPGEASRYLSIFWGGLMIGRFMAAFSLSETGVALKRGMMLALPAAAFIVLWTTRGGGAALNAGVLLVIVTIIFLATSSSPQRLLAACAAVNIILLVTAMTAGGGIGRWAVLGVGLFCSAMWGNIFSLAIAGLGALKSQASSFLVMAIAGGALLPPLQGLVADHAGIGVSFIVPMVAFAYVAFYGLYGYRAGARH
jgi:FHS family L-fucose permease-like MFS transporter